MSACKYFKGKVSDGAYIAMLEAENKSNEAALGLSLKQTGEFIFPMLTGIKAQLMSQIMAIYNEDKRISDEQTTSN